MVEKDGSTEGRRSSGQLQIAPPSSFPALECRVGLGRATVATDAIEILGEYSVGAPLPLTDRISYSIGVWEGDAVLSLSLVHVDGPAMRRTSGLLLATPGT